MLSAAMFLAGCSGGASAPSIARPSLSPRATSTSTESTASPSTDPLARFYAQKLRWASCRNGFQCTTLLVPVDYSHPSGGALRVSVIRKRSSGSHRGSLIVNPGGPGGSGIEFVREATAIFSGVTKHFDLVSFDPRGVGATRPVRCETSAQLDAFFHIDPTPNNSAAHAVLVQANRDFVTGCEKRNGSFLAHISTLDTARDMDVLRSAVGDGKLTYYGASYGTYLGAKYAQLFPTHIRAMVLDGAVDPTESTLQEDRDQAVGFEVDLRDFINNCVSHGKCPLGSTANSAMQSFDQLSARIERHPIPVGSRSVGAGEFFNGVADAMYSMSFWPALQTALTSASNGDGRVMLALSDDLTRRQPTGSYENLDEAFNAISCLDRGGPSQVPAYDAAAAAAAKVAPHFGEAIVLSSLPCAFWPVPPVEKPHAVAAPGAPPIVIIGTTHDPATPYAGAVALAHQLSSGVLLTYVGDGHTAYIRQDPCVDGAVNAYLVNVVVPRAGLRCS